MFIRYFAIVSLIISVEVFAIAKDKNIKGKTDNKEQKNTSVVKEEGKEEAPKKEQTPKKEETPKTEQTPKKEETLEEEDKEIQNQILILLYDTNTVRRRIAALLLGQYYFYADRELLIDTLIKALNDDDEKVRINSARSLARLKAYRAIDAIFKLIVDASANVRDQAVRAIGLIGTRRAKEPLIFALKDKDARVRISAIWGLTRLKAKGTLPSLIDMLFDKDDDARAYAVLSVGYFDDKRIVPFIKDIYNKDSSLKVRQNAYISLKRFGIVRSFPREEG